jgi:ribosomal protein L22
MVIFAMIIFGISLIGIVSLFVLKHWEDGSGRVLVPALRVRADARAMQLKGRLSHIQVDLARIAPLALLYMRYLIHEGALGFAAFARISERQAHRVADLVSHKRTFVARAPRSEYLKKVGERKNGMEDHS